MSRERALDTATRLVRAEAALNGSGVIAAGSRFVSEWVKGLASGNDERYEAVREARRTVLEKDRFRFVQKLGSAGLEGYPDDLAMYRVNLMNPAEIREAFDRIRTDERFPQWAAAVDERDQAIQAESDERGRQRIELWHHSESNPVQTPRSGLSL